MKNLGRFAASGIDKKDRDGEESVRMVNYMDIYGNEIREISSTRSLMETTCPAWKAQKCSLLCGDLVFTPSSETPEDIGLSALITADLTNTVFSYHVLRFRFSADIDKNFRKYLCNNVAVLAQFSSICRGTTRQILNREDFRNIIVPIPPRHQQTTIADFLDRETARLDALIAKEERLLALLEEKRTALISHAVTKGLEPNAELQDSGIEWLGQIPRDWEVKKLKYCSSLIVKKSLDAKHLPYIGLENIEAWTGRHIKETDQKPEAVANLFEIEDVLFGKLRPYLAKVLMPNFKGRCTGELLVFRPREYNSKFLQYLLLSDNFINNVDASTYGAKMPRAEWDFIGNLKLPLPLRPQQTAIADFLDQATVRIDALKTKINRAIELLREKRTALISAAVTGKIKT